MGIQFLPISIELFLDVAALLFQAIATALVIWAGIVAIFHLVYVEIEVHTGHRGRRNHPWKEMRAFLGQRLVLAIEFFLVADLILLVLDSSLNGVVRIGVMVIIRSMLAYSLKHEVT